MGNYSANTSVRHPAVAGLFYPDDADALRQLLAHLLDEAHPDVHLPASPKALIVPHAGYPYSGPVAAAAYSLLEPIRERIDRVVLIGPAHRIYLNGIALPKAEVFATPLGEIDIDSHGRAQLLSRGDVLASDAPHELEHCIEVQLPFLQTVLDNFTLLPLIVGVAPAQQVESVLLDVWGGPETLVLISSDLSHYHPYTEAGILDAATAKAIVHRRDTLTSEQACGAAGINGLLRIAQRLGLTVTEVARQNSGDTSGDIHRVVGYGAFAIHEPQRNASS